MERREFHEFWADFWEPLENKMNVSQNISLYCRDLIGRDSDVLFNN